MASWGTSISGALVGHAFRLLTFRHDGAGLPKQRSGLFILVIGLVGVVNFAALALGLADPNATVVTEALFLVWLGAIYAFMGRGSQLLPACFAFLLLVLTMAVLTLALRLVLGGPLDPSLRLPFVLWQAAAYYPIVRRKKPTSGGDSNNKKNSNSDDQIQ